ncbi:hypothetical protein DDZ18_03570 [Marinicauda salina]|uniref:Uncharacterized protein n=1 Tax=Marinicauda salina TaxID=2135793 RepID=A0A2U2BXE6_9PROT|nr:hypothetical protein [Marinicauda salina]PWE18682.1 hypothetical protein DDZ18_03570 [Marinicauda salina]
MIRKPMTIPAAVLAMLVAAPAASAQTGAAGPPDPCERGPGAFPAAAENSREVRDADARRAAERRAQALEEKGPRSAAAERANRREAERCGAGALPSSEAGPDRRRGAPDR